MTLFMLSAYCWGEIANWKSLAMLSSSTSAAVGLSAWSQDWAKVLALLATPYWNLSQSASLPTSRLSLPSTMGMPPDATHSLDSASVETPVAKNFLATAFSAAEDFEEIERYWPGLPTVLLGSPLPPSTVGKLL